MFVGNYNLKLDRGNRIVLPSPLLNEVDEPEFIVTFIDKDTLMFFPKSKWSIEKILPIDILNSENRDKYLSFIYNYSFKVNMLSQNRVSVPSQLIGMLSKDFKESLRLVGNGEYFTLVSERAFLEKQKESFEGLSLKVRKISGNN